MHDEQGINDLERAQFGATSTRQLHELGLSASSIKWRIQRGRNERGRRLVLVNPAVPETFEQKAISALLATADDLAFISHETAARVWESPLPTAALIEVSTELKKKRSITGVRCHRTSLLDEEDVTLHRGMRVSTPARTIVDISGRFDMKALGRIIDDALRRNITTLEELRETVERVRPAPGRSQKKMRVLLARRDKGVEEHESYLEDFVLDALKRFNIPLPVAQYAVTVNGRERRIDHCYVERRFVLEAQGFEWHSQRSRFDEDALRGNELELAGFRVLEFTSAFSDWQIACQVAQMLELPKPRRPKRVLSYSDWCHRLVVAGRPDDPRLPNG